MTKNLAARSAVGVFGRLPNSTDFDLRLNRSSARKFGCIEVIEQQVRDAPWGPIHMPSQELKTLCFKMVPTKGEDRQPFIIMANSMASSQFDNGAIKRFLTDNGWGKKFDMQHVDIKSLFDIETGEVHPLSLVPKVLNDCDDTLPVVHIYDESLLERNYVTTNGGHPDWTTEFRSDQLIRCMQEHFNKHEERALVIVAPIVKPEVESTVSQPATPSKRSWSLEKIKILDSQSQDSESFQRHEKTAVFLTNDTTTLFPDKVRKHLKTELENVNSDWGIKSPRDMHLTVMRQAELDFETVKYPQCWQPLFEELSKAVAEMVINKVDLLFLDCNITPLEQLFADKMPPLAREFVLKRLRSYLGDNLKDISDENIFHEISQRITLLPKSVVVSEYLRLHSHKLGLLDVFMVGGSQISDPGLSKYHNDLISISDRVTVHVMEAEQSLRVKNAMFYMETTEERGKFKEVLELYKIVESMLPSIRDVAEYYEPMILLVSTSLCQAYCNNGSQLIPEDAIPFLVEQLNLSEEEVRKTREEINSIAVINSTDVYAQAASTYLAEKIGNYGYVFN
jgi:hypothetical protein